MSAMTPENASFLLHDVYLPALKNESRITRTVLQAVPDACADYRPDPISKSAFELAKHIATADVRFWETVLTGEFTAAALIPDSVRTPAEVVAWYDLRSAATLEALSKASPAQLTKSVDFRGLFQRPAVTFLMMGLHHTIHHRGQLSSYLRCMGAKVPAIYGESYDSAQAKKSVAQA